MNESKIKQYLDSHHVHYKSIEHPLTYTAQGTAHVTHIPGKEMAKTVIVNADGRMCMVVMPAHLHVDLRQLKSAMGAHTVELAEEEDFASRFPECEIGAMPPFGNLYGLDVYVQRDLAEDEEIAFNAGTHREVLVVSFEDFEMLVEPEMCNCALM
jgi:Ala-tRNA(Pro) deacylase